MQVFIKQLGMQKLRDLQEHIFKNKEKIQEIDFREFKYLISLLIIQLYKYFKTIDDIQINNNPFVLFTS